MNDKIKLLVVFLLIAAGVAGFYALQEGAAVLRVLSVLLGVSAAAAVFGRQNPEGVSLVLLKTQLQSLSVWFGQREKKPFRRLAWCWCSR